MSLGGRGRVMSLGGRIMPLGGGAEALEIFVNLLLCKGDFAPKAHEFWGLSM